MGVLRERMEQDLVARGRSVHTRRAYLHAVSELAKYHRRSPDQLTDREVQQYLYQSETWQTLLTTLRRTPWVAYAKPPFGGPERVLKYLSRYTHRVAISNHRLLFVGDGTVRFTWKDYADHNARKEMTLPAAEFLRRFLLHVVPRGFMRIRHYEIRLTRSDLRKCARSLRIGRPFAPFWSL